MQFEHDTDTLLAQCEAAAPGIDWKGLLQKFGLALLQFLFNYLQRLEPEPVEGVGDHACCVKQCVCMIECATACLKSHLAQE